MRFSPLTRTSSIQPWWWFTSITNQTPSHGCHPLAYHSYGLELTWMHRTSHWVWAISMQSSSYLSGTCCTEQIDYSAASSNGDIIQFHSKQQNVECTGHLFDAASRGHLRVAKWLLQNTEEMDFAAACGHLDLVRYLNDKSRKVNNGCQTKCFPVLTPDGLFEWVEILFPKETVLLRVSSEHIRRSKELGCVNSIHVDKFCWFYHFVYYLPMRQINQVVQTVHL